MRNIRFEEGDLGVHVNVLRKWIADFEADPAQAFPGQGQMKPEQAETRDEARADMFDYVERFYNPKRRHSTLGYLSPIAFEQQEALA